MYSRGEQTLRTGSTALKAVAVVLIVTAVCGILFFTGLAAAFFICTDSARDASFEEQRERLASLEKAYSEGTAPRLDEADICTFDLDAALQNGMRINRLQYLATHNSYKHGLNGGTDFVYRLFGLKGLAREGRTDVGSLTEQLNGGVRSLELDVCVADGQMTICHNPVAEPESYAPDVDGALKELKMWSDYNPHHLPVIIMTEFKSGVVGTDDPTAQDFAAFEAKLCSVLGDKLFTPRDALKEYGSFEALIASDGYPTVAETLGKFLFLIHATGDDSTGNGIGAYLDTDRTMKSLKMFVANAGDWSYEKESLFVVRNDLSEEWVRETVQRNVAENRIVRVQAGVFGDRNEELFDFALNAGANIISADTLPEAEENLRELGQGLPRSAKTVFARRQTA